MKNRLSTTQIAISGLLIAITVVMSYQNIYIFGPRSGRVTLRFIPMIYSSILLGPRLGLIIGGVSDPLIYFLTLGSPGLYFPGYMLTNMLVGFFPGFIIKKESEKNTLTLILKLLLITVIAFAITIFLDSYWLQITRGKGYWYYVISRSIPNVIQSVITFVTLYVLTTRIKKNYR